jgi:hypothetical protein
VPLAIEIVPKSYRVVDAVSELCLLNCAGDGPAIFAYPHTIVPSTTTITMMMIMIVFLFIFLMDLFACARAACAHEKTALKRFAP